MPKWLNYDSDGDAAESDYSRQPRNHRLRKQSRIAGEELPKKPVRKRKTSNLGEYEQNWIPAGPPRQRKTVPAR